jgi:DNA repair protein RadC
MNLPATELPRERMLRAGAEALSLSELLAIILVTGTKEKPVLRLADELISHFGSLSALFDASISELTQLKGIGQAKAIQLHAAFALAKRLSPEERPRLHIGSPDAAFPIARDAIGHEKQETALIIMRDARGFFLRAERFAIGTLSEILIHPREVFHPAVRHKAHSIILAHNHPSGDPSPSTHDLKLTRLLIQSSQVMGIPLDDHLIVTQTTYTSLRTSGHFGTSRTHNY